MALHSEDDRLVRTPLQATCPGHERDEKETSSHPRLAPLLGSTPILDLALSCQCVVSRWKLLAEHEGHGLAERSVAAELSTLVLSHPPFQVICMAYVKSPVGATEDVHPKPEHRSSVDGPADTLASDSLDFAPTALRSG